MSDQPTGSSHAAAAQGTASTGPTTFVLVHGSWHDGTCWDGVASHLRAAGHTVHAPTLPGNGERQDPAVTMAATSAAVSDLVTGEGLEDVVLVGHSFGGAVVQLVSQDVPDRLRRIVFHNAYVVPDGGSVLGCIPASAGAAFAALADDDGTLSLPFEFFHEHLMNDADEGRAREAFARLGPEPLARAGETLSLNAFERSAVPRSVVHATDDRVFPPEEFTWHPGQSGRLGAFRLVELPGSHEVLFTDPERLAAALVEAACD